tara:strand:- start:3387 stop:4349 length:963 start_codon:yes stop_codon:yes gene_type:complete
VKISQSKLKTFRRCPKQYEYKYIEGLEPTRKSVPLALGNWIHSMLEAHYKGEDWLETYGELTHKFNGFLAEEKEHYGDLPGISARLMNGYMDFWEEEDKNLEVISVEEEFEVDIGKGLLFKFKPDMIVKDKRDGMISCWDHKSNKTLPDTEWRNTDIQSTLYLWALNQLGIKVDQFIFNYIRTKPPTVPRMTKAGRMSKVKIETDYPTLKSFIEENDLVIDDNLQTWLDNLKANSNFYKRISIAKPQLLTNTMIEELYSTATMINFMDSDDDLAYYRVLNKACDWDCSFQDLCNADLMGSPQANQIRKQRYQKEVRNGRS